MSVSENQTKKNTIIDDNGSAKTAPKPKKRRKPNPDEVNAERVAYYLFGGGGCDPKHTTNPGRYYVLFNLDTKDPRGDKGTWALGAGCLNWVLLKKDELGVWHSVRCRALKGHYRGVNIFDFLADLKKLDVPLSDEGRRSLETITPVFNFANWRRFTFGHRTTPPSWIRRGVREHN